MVLLDTGTPGTSRGIYREDADGETRTRNHGLALRILRGRGGISLLGNEDEPIFRG